MIVLILAGGEGSRVWPLSKSKFPKQFLNSGGQYSLLQKTVLRFKSYPFVTRLVISTNESYTEFVKLQMDEIECSSFCDILSEPLRKNTAPAIAYSLRYLQETGQIEGKEKVLVVPSDHFIEPETHFRHYLELLDEKVQSKIVILGVSVKKPETGYGYIKIASFYDELTYEIETFTEKPTFELACQYVKSGNYFWNCGIFLFSIDLFWKQMEMHSPEIFHLAEKSFAEVKESYGQFPEISIDYALMEKTKEIVLLPLSIDWFDIGCWDSVYELLEKDPNGNVFVGKSQGCDVKESLIFNHSAKTIMVIGVDDLIVVNTEDSVLIVKKGSSQKIKNLLKKSC